MTQGRSRFKYFISTSLVIHLLMLGAFLREASQHTHEAKDAHQLTVQLLNTSHVQVEKRLVKKIATTKASTHSPSPVSATETVSEASQASATAPVALTHYASKVENLINENKHYPRSARALKQTGLVHVSLTILKNGKLKDANVIKKSKFYSLDKASLDTIEGIGNFPKFPEDLKTEEITFIVPINFNY